MKEFKNNLTKNNQNNNIINDINQNQTIDDFINTSSHKLLQKMTDISFMKEYRTDHDYFHEREALNNFSFPSWPMGICVGLSSFIFFRVTNARLRNFVRQQVYKLQQKQNKRSSMSQSVYTFEPTAKNSIVSSKISEYKPSFMVKISELTLQLYVSIKLGKLYASSFDNTSLLDHFSRLPLVPGKSLISDTLCPDLLSFTSQVHEGEFQRYKESKSGRQLELEAIERFIKNCIRRKEWKKFSSSTSEIDGDRIPSDMDVLIPWKNNGINSNDVEFGSGFKNDMEFGNERDRNMELEKWVKEVMIDENDN